MITALWILITAMAVVAFSGWILVYALERELEAQGKNE
jgi:hypothetical protein